MPVVAQLELLSEKHTSHTVDRIEVFLRLVMKLLSFRLEFGETSLSINKDRIFGVVANVEFLLKLLRRPRDGLGKAFDTHPDLFCVLLCGELIGCSVAGIEDEGLDGGTIWR